MKALKEFKTPAVEIGTLHEITNKYATWVYRNGLNTKMGHCMNESLDTTIKRLISFCDSVASAGQVIEVKTNFDRDAFLYAINVNRPYIINVVC